MSDDDLKEIFNVLDESGDGNIDFSEFLHYMVVLRKFAQTIEKGNPSEFEHFSHPKANQLKQKYNEIYEELQIEAALVIQRSWNNYHIKLTQKNFCEVVDDQITKNKAIGSQVHDDGEVDESYFDEDDSNDDETDDSGGSENDDDDDGDDEEEEEEDDEDSKTNLTQTDYTQSDYSSYQYQNKNIAINEDLEYGEERSTEISSESTSSIDSTDSPTKNSQHNFRLSSTSNTLMNQKVRHELMLKSNEINNQQTEPSHLLKKQKGYNIEEEIPTFGFWAKLNSINTESSIDEDDTFFEVPENQSVSEQVMSQLDRFTDQTGQIVLFTTDISPTTTIPIISVAMTGMVLESLGISVHRFSVIFQEQQLGLRLTKYHNSKNIHVQKCSSEAKAKGICSGDILVSLNFQYLDSTFSIENVLKLIKISRRPLNASFWRVLHPSRSSGEQRISFDDEPPFDIDFDFDYSENGIILLSKVGKSASEKGLLVGDVLIGVNFIPICSFSATEPLKLFVQNVPLPVVLHIWR